MRRNEQNQLTLVCSFKDEETAAPEFIKTLIDLLESRDQNFTLVLVDDGSTDKTSRVLNRFVSERVFLVTLGSNVGKIAAQAIGALKFRELKGDLVFFDGDGQHHPTEILKVVEKGIQTKRITVGQRSAQYKRRKLSFVGTTTLNILLKILGIKVELKNSELIFIPEIVRKRVLEDSNFGYLPINAVIAKEEFDETPITIFPRIMANQNGNDTRHSRNQLFAKAIFQIYSHPMDMLIRVIAFGLILSSTVFIYGLYIGIYSLIKGDPNGVGSIIVILSFSTIIMLLLGILSFGFLVVMNEWIKNRQALEKQLK